MALSVGKHRVTSGIVISCAGLLLGISSAALVQNPTFAQATPEATSEAAGSSSAPPSVLSELAGEGQAQAKTEAKPAADAATAGELDYDKALEALMKTKAHTEEASNWERRTIVVPPGVDPQTVIQQNMINVSAPDGSKPGKIKVEPIKIDGVLPANQEAPATPAAKTPEGNGGWEWLSKDADGKKIEPAQQAQEPVKVEETVAAPTPGGRPTSQPKSSFTTVFDATKDGGANPVRTRPVSFNASAAAPSDNDVIDLGGDDSAKPNPLRSANSLNKPQAKPAAKRAQPAEEPQEMAEQNAPAKDEAAEEEQGPKKNAAEVARDAISTYNSAVKLHLSGHLSEAIEEYQAALEANPELSQAHCNLGLIYNQQHEYAKAIQEFRKALAIDPKDAITYNGIGAAFRAQNDKEAAIKNWKTAISLDPKLATAHYNLGTVYELQKEYDRALESYTDAIKNDSRLGEAYYRSGLILARTKRTEEAKEMLSKAIKISKNAEYSEDARKRLALMEQGKAR